AQQADAERRVLADYLADVGRGTVRGVEQLQCAQHHGGQGGQFQGVVDQVAGVTHVDPPVPWRRRRQMRLSSEIRGWSGLVLRNCSSICMDASCTDGAAAPVDSVPEGAASTWVTPWARNSVRCRAVS